VKREGIIAQCPTASPFPASSFPWMFEEFVAPAPLREAADLAGGRV
jgi:hypothetical protein